jgi:hypothetical protein
MRRVVGLLLIIVGLVACAAETAVGTTAVAPTAVPFNTPTEPATTMALVAPSSTAVLPTPTLHMPDTPAPAEPSPPTAVPAAIPQPTDMPTPTVTVPGVVYGRTAEGAFFQGYPDAPITLIDYSDFL